MRLPARPSLPQALWPASLLAVAAAASLATAPPAHADAVSVPVYHSLRLPVGGRAASVVVGNPAVADVTVVDSHTLFVVGKSFGSTDVTVLDPLGRTVFARDIQVVNGAGRQITLYRGSARSDLACNPACTAPEQLASQTQAPAAGAAPANPAAAAAGAGAAVGALAGGALGNAISGAIGPR